MMPRVSFFDGINEHRNFPHMALQIIFVFQSTINQKQLCIEDILTSFNYPFSVLSGVEVVDIKLKIGSCCVAALSVNC